MNVLLVDDEYGKTEAIVKALASLGLPQLSVQHETTATAARRRMQEELFDLLLIDINLPETVGSAASHEGGIRLYDMLVVDERVRVTPEVLFITAREDLISEANEMALRRGALLCCYSESSNQWREILLGRAASISQRLSKVIPKRSTNPIL